MGSTIMGKGEDIMGSTIMGNLVGWFIKKWVIKKRKEKKSLIASRWNNLAMCLSYRNALPL